MGEPKILGVYVDLVEAFVRVYGQPLPKELLEIGDPEDGWHVLLNPTREPVKDVLPFHASVSWNGFPAGILNPGGGLLAAGELANEETFSEWLKTQ